MLCFRSTRKLRFNLTVLHWVAKVDIAEASEVREVSFHDFNIFNVRQHDSLSEEIALPIIVSGPWLTRLV